MIDTLAAVQRRGRTAGRPGFSGTLNASYSAGHHTVAPTFVFHPQVEALLASEDYGKDLASVNNLLKKHQLLEADISAHEVTRGGGGTLSGTQLCWNWHTGGRSVMSGS